MISIAVFCGSSTGKDDLYRQTSLQLASYFLKHEITLVYGGGNIGLMGVIADEIMLHNGKVIGVIPEFLAKREVANHDITQLIVVETMHQRKQKMCDLSDAFLILPGGFGSMDELFEILTWKQLGLHHKPIAVLNINGYYNSLLQLIDNMSNQQFVSPDNKKLLMFINSVDEIGEWLGSY